MIKKIVHIFLGLTLLSSTAWAWTIEEFNVQADISPDGYIEIQETIKADFTNELYKRGIFRDLPLRYKDENNTVFETPIENISVTDETGTPRPFTKSRVDSELSLKIGAPNANVKASETYIINYTVSGVINAFEDYDEFYWNVTGNGWDALINEASIAITLPDGNQHLQTKCFTGPKDSVASNCEIGAENNSQIAAFRTTQALVPGEGLTSVIGWDKGLVAIPERVYPTDIEALAKKLQWLFLTLPLLGFFRNWRIRNQLKPRKPIIPLYHPPEGLGVGLIGYFDRGQPHHRDITAIITQLCVKKFIKIKEIETSGVFKKIDYEITALEKPQTTLDKEEEFVYHRLAVKPGQSMLLSEIAKHKSSIFHYANYSQFMSQSRLELSHYFRSKTVKPVKVLLSVMGGFLMFFVAIVFSGMAQSLIPIVAYFVGIIAALALPQFNKEGQLIKHDIKGYKKFLKTADKQRINWSEAQHIFEKNLPYAVALNLTDKWAKIFGDKIQPPEWCEGQKQPNFNHFEKTITSSTAAAVRRSTPKPARSTSSSRGSSGFSRGGGRSGGGFGGGGGGSW